MSVRQTSLCVGVEFQQVGRVCFHVIHVEAASKVRETG